MLPHPNGDFLGKELATIRAHSERPGSRTPSANIAISSSQLKPVDPPLAPASTVTNPKLRQLIAEVNASKGNTPEPVKMQRLAPAKSSIAILEAKAGEMSSSDSDSDSDDEPPRKIPAPTQSARPDPMIRDRTPASEGSDEEDD